MHVSNKNTRTRELSHENVLLEGDVMDDVMNEVTPVLLPRGDRALFVLGRHDTVSETDTHHWDVMSRRNKTSIQSETLYL